MYGIVGGYGPAWVRRGVGLGNGGVWAWVRRGMGLGSGGVWTPLRGRDEVSHWQGQRENLNALLWLAAELSLLPRKLLALEPRLYLVAPAFISPVCFDNF